MYVSGNSLHVIRLRGHVTMGNESRVMVGLKIKSSGDNEEVKGSESK